MPFTISKVKLLPITVLVLSFQQVELLSLAFQKVQQAKMHDRCLWPLLTHWTVNSSG